MKKKKLIGKLSLEKSRISALNESKIRGGFGITLDPTFCASNCNDACITYPNYTCSGSQNCGGTNNGGSECACL